MLSPCSSVLHSRIACLRTFHKKLMLWIAKWLNLQLALLCGPKAILSRTALEPEKLQVHSLLQRDGEAFAALDRVERKGGTC